MQDSTQLSLNQGGASKRRERRISKIIFACVLAGASIGLVWASGASAADIQPRDGHWVAVIKFRSVSGCSVQMRNEIESDAADEVLYSKALEFPNPLDLNKMDKAWNVDATWTRKGPNQWAGVMSETERTLFGKISSVTAINTQVLSDGKIDQQSVTTVTFPPRMARKFGTSKPCVINSDILHRLR